MSHTELHGIQQSLSGFGMIAVNRMMDVNEFCSITGYSKSLIRHFPERFEHLMVKGPARKTMFDAFKVQQAIRSGNLCG